MGTQKGLSSKLPLIGMVIAVLFIISGVMRAILGLFGNPAASEPTVLDLCVSSSIGQSNAADLVTAYLQNMGGHKVVQSAGPRAGTILISSQIPGRSAAVRVFVSIVDSATAFNRLLGHDCNVGLITRDMDPIEASRFSVPPAVTLVALDGAVVVVHPNNPIHTLTLSELRGIFGGTIHNWSHLGLKPRAVKVVMPPQYSDEISIFTNRVLEGQIPMAHFSRTNNVAVSVSGPHSRGAIGLTTFHASDPARFVRIIDGAGREFTPSTLAIQRRSYPLTFPIYAYRDAADMSNLAYKFLTFLESSAGQNVLVEDGFVTPYSQ
jgi:phosphate transport system substrate-binding protein